MSETTSRSTLEATFRSEWGQLIATATRLLGDLDQAEEVVQQVLVTALERWPFSGVPDNPGAWLLVATRRRALDRLRSQRVRREKQPLLVNETLVRSAGLAADPDEEADLADAAIADDRLRLIFTCCHPVLPAPSQVALTLRLLGGLGTSEIATALLTRESALAQRIVRAKKTLREGRIAYRTPEAAELPERLPAVLHVLYLIFNEGYAASEGDARLRPELCAEALRLATMLGELLPDEEEVVGLIGLMTIHRARESTRTTPEGSVVLLEQQDRARWDRLAIERAMRRIEPLVDRDDAGAYLLQAAIAGCHATAASFDATDWPTILSLYRRLEAIAPSPVVALNRVVASSFAEGPETALGALEALAEDARLARYAPLEAARADLLRRVGRLEEAGSAYARAIELSDNGAERDLLRERRAALRKG